MDQNGTMAQVTGCLHQAPVGMITMIPEAKDAYDHIPLMDESSVSPDQTVPVSFSI
jgi:hypothetical protein